MVTIITRTKDRPLFLARALQSVANQTFQDYEHVIINDGGKATEVDELINKLKPEQAQRTKVIHSSSSVGMDVATNQVLKQTHGELVAIHDDDDSWQPEFLQSIVNAMQSAPANFRGAITHSIKIVEEVSGDKIIEISREPFNSDLNSLSLLDLSYENRFPPISFVFRRDALKEVGMYREDIEVLADWDFNLRFLAKYDILVLPHLLANYHQRVGVKSGSHANTIHGSVDKYILFESVIRNDYLRQDLESGKIGLGFWLNIGKFLKLNEKQNSKLLALSEAQHRWLTKLKSNPVVKLIRGGK